MFNNKKVMVFDKLSYFTQLENNKTKVFFKYRFSKDFVDNMIVLFSNKNEKECYKEYSYIDMHVVGKIKSLHGLILYIKAASTVKDDCEYMTLNVMDLFEEINYKFKYSVFKRDIMDKLDKALESFNYKLLYTAIKYGRNVEELRIKLCKIHS